VTGRDERGRVGGTGKHHQRRKADRCTLLQHPPGLHDTNWISFRKCTHCHCVRVPLACQGQGATGWVGKRRGSVVNSAQGRCQKRRRRKSHFTEFTRAPTTHTHTWPPMCMPDSRKKIQALVIVSRHSMSALHTWEEVGKIRGGAGPGGQQRVAKKRKRSSQGRGNARPSPVHKAHPPNPQVCPGPSAD
jgi:hypothetical protein